LENRVLVGIVVRDNAASFSNYFHFIYQTYKDSKTMDFYFLSMIPSMDIIGSILILFIPKLLISRAFAGF